MMSLGYSIRSVPSRALGLAALTLPLLASAPASAETRGYIIHWFATATHSTNFAENCPKNLNGGYTELLVRDLMDIGHSKEEAYAIVTKAKENLPNDLRVKTTNRAVVNGRNVSVYNYPEAVTRNLETVTGPYGYGFDLDGKRSANEFTDPDTKQKIDNQLWRAIGCTDSYRAIPPQKPYPEDLPWDTLLDTSPGWAIQLEAADFSKDGDVTVTLDRLTQNLRRDANGKVMSGATYVIDPNSRSRNVLKGKMKDGVITVSRTPNFYLESEMPYYAEIALRDAQMRITMKPDGTLVSFVGGYYKWKDFAYMHTARPANGADSIGIYHALKKMADAYPDPKTGENTYISATFRFEALPSFLANVDGKVVAAAGVDARPVTAANTGAK
jgi:hypothetical protein